jgi:hypothetical protein
MKPNTLKEWSTEPKSGWGTGPWNDEPDKRQWVDERTGYPCLMVRNGSMGFWCGYVGLPKGHRLYKQGYDDSYRHGIEAHGGLTFAAECADRSKAAWRQFQKRIVEDWTAMRGYPRGDSARRVREWGAVIDDYDKWRDRMMATHVCHIPEPGASDRVWWLGFDCGHAGDYAPGIRSLLGPSRREEQYRDLAFVQSEVEALAHQLYHLDREPVVEAA